MHPRGYTGTGHYHQGHTAVRFDPWVSSVVVQVGPVYTIRDLLALKTAEYTVITNIKSIIVSLTFTNPSTHSHKGRPAPVHFKDGGRIRSIKTWMGCSCKGSKEYNERAG